jgi:hypothetical protein
MQYILKLEKNSAKNTFTKTQELFLNKLITIISEVNPISSTTSYNSFIRELVTFAKKQYRIQIITPLYDKEIKRIEKRILLTEKTIWGGISFTEEPIINNMVEKLLVIKPYGILGLEVHEKKEEQLEIREGVCLMLHSDIKNNNETLAISLAKKGDMFSFKPGEIHGIITLTKTVIQETSQHNPEDLTYIFKASQIM